MPVDQSGPRGPGGTAISSLERKAVRFLEAFTEPRGEQGLLYRIFSSRLTLT